MFNQGLIMAWHLPKMIHLPQKYTWICIQWCSQPDRLSCNAENAFQQMCGWKLMSITFLDHISTLLLGVYCKSTKQCWWRAWSTSCSIWSDGGMLPAGNMPPANLNAAILSTPSPTELIHIRTSKGWGLIAHCWGLTLWNKVKEFWCMVGHWPRWN